MKVLFVAFVSKILIATNSQTRLLPLIMERKMTNQTNASSTQSWTGPKARDAWERSGWLWTGTFFLGIVLGLIFVFQDETLPTAVYWSIIGLNVLLVAWHLGSLLLVRRIGHYRENLPFGLIYIAGLILIWFALVRIHPAFYVVQMGVWSQLFIALPITWAVIFAVLIFGLNLFQQTIGIGLAINWLAALQWLGFTAVGILFGLWIHTIISQSAERKKLIQELEATRAELAQSERESGMLAERQRLAHEIHDTLAQGFISIIMHLEAAEQALEEGLPTTDRHLQQARQTARESLEQARRVVNDLRPEVLDSAPFDEAVRRVVADWSAGSGVTAVFTCTGNCHPLHPQVEVTLLRATQEALANVRKHAQASNVQVTLSYLDDVVILDVQDDGVGFGDDSTKETAVSAPLSVSVSGGFGLVAMRQRVERLGGELLIESEPGEGTTVAVSIPVK
jgi:signal transduction histidine kinase